MNNVATKALLQTSMPRPRLADARPVPIPMPPSRATLPDPTDDSYPPHAIEPLHSAEYEKVNSALQIAWNNVMSLGSYSSAASYSKVSVLLLSWEADIDDLKVQDEVKRLGKLFEETFNYTVKYQQLVEERKSRRTPQAQMNAAVANFVLESDSTNEKSLMLVYYAGHGSAGLGGGELHLAGNMSPAESHLKSAARNNKLIWNYAESALQNTCGDVLEIFDCCCAGNLDITRGDTRMFEYFAATSADSPTIGPGEKSFTSALIWALTDLVKTRRQFTTYHIWEKIKKEAPHFPKDQKPVLTPRGNTSSGGRIVLEPLPKGGATQPSALRITEHQELLTLKFLLDTRPTQKNIEELGDELNYIVKKIGLPVNRIMWGGLESWQGNVFLRAANKFMSFSESRRRRITRDEAALQMSLVGHHPPYTTSPNELWALREESAFLSKERIHAAVQQDLAHETHEVLHHSVPYHVRMALVAMWALVMGSNAGAGARGFRGVGGLLLFISVAVGLSCFFFLNGVVSMYGGM